MKVAVISRSDESAGGACRAAHLLAVGLRSQGCQVDEWIVFPKSKHIGECNLVFSGHLGRLVPYATYLGSRILGLPDLLGMDIIKIPKLAQIHKYDVVHFHDVVMAISPITLSIVSNQAAVFQTLHDCSTFTAGCTYPDSCSRFTNGCGRCPQIRSWPMSSFGPDLTKTLHYLKRRIHSRSSIELIAPSQWIRRLAMESSVVSRQPHLIPYGVDTDLIRPLDKGTVRDVLGLPTDRKIVTFAATHVDDPRKGFRLAIEAAARLGLPREQLMLLAIGHPPKSHPKQTHPDVDCRFIGFIHDMRLMMQYLTASDVFLFPTLNDNLPFVVLESMAAGTPTVAFRTGGVPEMIDHGKTGYVADQGDINGLVEGLRNALHGNQAREWGLAARRRAESVYSLRQHTLTHMTLYEKQMRRTAR